VLQKVSLKGLWVSTIVILLIAALQGLSGHWVAFFLLWPGGPTFGQTLIRILIGLSGYHIKAGFAVGAISVPVLFFAFFSKSNILVRIFAVVGFIIVILAVMGGFLYVTSKLQDRWSLGQMADAFVGVFAAYFLQIIFMIKTPKFPWKRAKGG
jgi:hypothetical protein